MKIETKRINKTSCLGIKIVLYSSILKKKKKKKKLFYTELSLLVILADPSYFNQNGLVVAINSPWFSNKSRRHLNMFLYGQFIKKRRKKRILSLDQS